MSVVGKCPGFFLLFEFRQGKMNINNWRSVRIDLVVLVVLTHPLWELWRQHHTIWIQQTRIWAKQVQHTLCSKPEHLTHSLWCLFLFRSLVWFVQSTFSRPDKFPHLANEVSAWLRRPFINYWMTNLLWLRTSLLLFQMSHPSSISSTMP